MAVTVKLMHDSNNTDPSNTEEVLPVVPGLSSDESIMQDESMGSIDSEDELFEAAHYNSEDNNSDTESEVVSGSEVEPEAEREALSLPKNASDVKKEIHSTINVLRNYKSKTPNALPRSVHIEKLSQSLSSFFGYSAELTEMILKLFSPEEALQFMEANETPRPLTIRSNPLKTRRRELAQLLIRRGVNLDPLGDWADLGLKIVESQVPVGATPEYLAGLYMLQSASSMVPVIALAPRENERVADLCAAPGGKTTHIAALMKNSGSLVANDVNKDRLKALIANLHRMGVSNTTVSNYDAMELGSHFPKFDRILLDAPCTGLGVISKDESIKSVKSRSDVEKCSHAQKKLILKAIDMLDAKSKTGAVLVYSTCSIMVEENEEVINYALKKRNVKLVSLNIDFGVPGFVKMGAKRFHPHMKETRRFYPHVHNMDGFFVAKLVKFGETLPGSSEEELTFDIEKDQTDDLEVLIKSKSAMTGRSKKKKIKAEARKTKKAKLRSLKAKK